jgi:alpha-galactosidase
VVTGGAVRGVYTGPLPAFAAELCRRQITIHEILTEATMTGDRRLAAQAMLLDPYVRGVAQARKLVDAYLKTYAEQLPQFQD